MSDHITPRYSAANILKAYDEQIRFDRDVDKYRRVIYGMKSLSNPDYVRSTSGARDRSRFGTSTKETNGMISRMKLLQKEEQDWLKGQFEKRQIDSMGNWETDDDFMSWLKGQGDYIDRDKALTIWNTEKNQRRAEAGELRQAEKFDIEKTEAADLDLIDEKSIGYANDFIVDYSVDPTHKGQRNVLRAIRSRVMNDEDIPRKLKAKVIADSVKRLQDQFGTVGRYDAAQEEARLAKIARTTKTDDEKDAVNAYTTLITDRYAGRWRGQSSDIQQGILAEIQREISNIPLDKIPLELRSGLFESVRKSLGQYGEMGAAYKARVEEKRLSTAESRRETEFTQSQADRKEKKKGTQMAREMAARVIEKMEGGLSKSDAVKEVLKDRLGTKVSDKGIKAELFETPFVEEEFNRILSGVGREYTAAKKMQLENERDLVRTGDPQKDVNSFNQVLEREMIRGPQLSPSWHEYGIWKKRGIAIGNALAVFERVNPGHIDRDVIEKDWNEFMEDEDIKEYLAILGKEEKNAYRTKLLQAAADDLGIPLVVMQYILFPEAFKIGKR